MDFYPVKGMNPLLTDKKELMNPMKIKH